MSQITRYVQGLLVWLRKHWSMMLGRPTNGATSLKKIEEQLSAIKRQRRRVSTATSKMASDVDSAKKLIEENDAVIRTNN